MDFLQWLESLDTTLPTFKIRHKSQGHYKTHNEQFEIGDLRSYKKCLYDTGGKPECEKLYSRYKVEIVFYPYSLDHEETMFYGDSDGKWPGSQWHHVTILEVHFDRRNRIGKFVPDASGTGNQMQVFGAVKNIADKYIDFYRPDILLTTCKVDEGS